LVHKAQGELGAWKAWSTRCRQTDLQRDKEKAQLKKRRVVSSPNAKGDANRRQTKKDPPEKTVKT